MKKSKRTQKSKVRIVVTKPSRLFTNRLWAIMAGLVVVVCGVFYMISQAATNPLQGSLLYVDTVNNPAASQAAQWRNSRPADASQMDKIANRPRAFWMGGWTPDSRAAANDYTSRATAKGALGVIIVYNIPSRDCGSYSAGGASSHTAYRSWVDGIAAGIGSRKTVVVLEPDAVPQFDCLDAAGKQARIDSLKYAISKFQTLAATYVYIDIGNPTWLSPAEAATRLQQVNIAAADGFSLNVSNFYTTTQNTTYGNDISGRVGGKHFVIDTSRNGLGSNGEWCNPAGRALGESPSTTTRSPLVDAYLWLKAPGESDGACNGAPAAGVWWPEYALGLAQRSSLPVAYTQTTSPPAPTPAPNPAPAPTPTPPAPNPQPNPTPSPSPPNGSSTSIPDVISGTIDLPDPEPGSNIVSVTLNGQEVDDPNNIDTSLLPDGDYTLEVTLTDEAGEITTMRQNVTVDNDLNPFERMRNFLYVFFKGNKIATYASLGAIAAGITTGIVYGVRAFLRIRKPPEWLG
jgi:endoglucanase